MVYPLIPIPSFAFLSLRFLIFCLFFRDDSKHFHVPRECFCRGSREWPGWRIMRAIRAAKWEDTPSWVCWLNMKQRPWTPSRWWVSQTLQTSWLSSLAFLAPQSGRSSSLWSTEVWKGWSKARPCATRVLSREFTGIGWLANEKKSGSSEMKWKEGRCGWLKHRKRETPIDINENIKNETETKTEKRCILRQEYVFKRGNLVFYTSKTKQNTNLGRQ